MKQEDLHPSVVQQLMFNRILACVRRLSVDHVTITSFDAQAGTLEGSLAGVNFVVNVTADSSVSG